MEMDGNTLQKYVDQHTKNTARFDVLENYYKGKHPILNRTKPTADAPNNMLVCNFAKYITDTAVGYAFGSPARYSFGDVDTAGADILLALAEAGDATHDAELAKDLSVFGTGFELIYIYEDKPQLTRVDPRNAFIITESSVRERPIYGIVYGATGDGDAVEYYVYDEAEMYTFISPDGKKKPELIQSESHFFGMIPLLQYFNNEEGMGDFEHVLTLIDAYNTLQSDRINDKERFVDSILLIQGCSLPDDELASKMLASRILELPFDQADAKYLTKTMNEAQTEILKRALADDIHKFSQIPDFSDEHFSGNTSGVAIKYKLLSVENLAKVKERFFIAGLQQRVGLFCRALQLFGHNEELNRINITFNRSLPINEYETAKTIQALHETEILSKEELRKRIGV